MKKIFVLLFIFLLSAISFSDQKENYIKGRVTEKVRSYQAQEFEDEVERVDVYKVLIEEGIDAGKVIEVDFPIYRETAFNIPLKEGADVVLYTEIADDGKNVYYISDIDKRNNMLLLGGLFIVLTFILSRFKGLKAVLALGITVLGIFKFFLPGVIYGYSPILLSVVMAFFASLVTIYLISGFNHKGRVAMIGSIGGVAFAGILSYIFSIRMGITGYSDIDALNYAPLLAGIKVRELVSAGVILGSMGAVMDVAVSISSALDEIKQKNPHLHPMEIFKSGMNIGSDIIGTMVNTLILAYIGSSLFTVMLLVMQRTEYPVIRILNFEFMAVEILRSLCGSIGILVAVPLTSYLSSFRDENRQNQGRKKTG
ncbi:YibE/F family protein [uncultured Ilyobacter sp.]|uniref:YibE/F family protein n=1 Tax=uncultured Ilyobacter sp. TaxID=544433 RepID=UPI0029C0EFAB|nr:YibE/F family protein [uncultured Ilyobacter sp.]